MCWIQAIGTTLFHTPSQAGSLQITQAVTLLFLNHFGVNSMSHPGPIGYLFPVLQLTAILALDVYGQKQHSCYHNTIAIYNRVCIQFWSCLLLPFQDLCLRCSRLTSAQLSCFPETDITLSHWSLTYCKKINKKIRTDTGSARRYSPLHYFDQLNL